MGHMFSLLTTFEQLNESWRPRKKRKLYVGESSNIATECKSSEGVDDGPILDSKHKIFLSHSGVQKEFTDCLFEALKVCYYNPFFDRESLHKGEPFSNTIVKAAQRCELFVVVLSEDYFMSKWPMIELNAFVQAKVNGAILPLFYGLSADDVKDEKRQQRWLEEWEKFAKADPRIKVEDWKKAFYKLTTYNGLIYDQKSKPFTAYVKKIVSSIFHLVSPDVKWDDSHVQGNVHEVVLDKMKEIELSQRYKVKVVGIHGVGGIGKTTMCKILCNKLLSEFEGRVCYIEFNSTCSNSKELWQNAVVKLTRRSADCVRDLDEGQCQGVLNQELPEHPTFMAIDNVWENHNSKSKAMMFLRLHFHKDSLLLVTARSSRILASLGINGDACLEMPELGHEDAMKLFLYHAAHGEQFTNEEDIASIEDCVRKCYFCKGDKGDYHFHPLALEVLGRQLCGSGEKPSKWPQLSSEGCSSSSRENAVLDTLRGSFINLPGDHEKTLFMDVGFFLHHLEQYYSMDFIPWMSLKKQLCLFYRTSEKEIQSQLDKLKQGGLLQDADFLALGKVTMHDLYHEVLIQEAAGKLGDEKDMLQRKWVLVSGDQGHFSELEVAPPGERWYNLSRLSVWQTEKTYYELLLDPASCDHLPTIRLKFIKWQYFSNVRILQLRGLKFGPESLNLEGMKCLWKLQLLCCDYNPKMTLEGLGSLEDLTIFEWRRNEISACLDIVGPSFVGQFPSSVKYLHIHEPCKLPGSNVLAHCNKLITLKLVEVEVGELLDLSNCSSLESLVISLVFNLKTISGLSSNLHTLKIGRSSNITSLERNQLDGLVRLEVVGWEDGRMPHLLSSTKLEVLTIDRHSEPLENFIPLQLRELHCGSWKLQQVPCLNAFKQLQVLDLSWSISLKLLHGLGDLLALQSLDLHRCSSLQRLPNLSKSRSLEKLKLDDCTKLELYKEDFEILAKLSSLKPVLFTLDGARGYMLDIVGRKVLRSQEEYYGEFSRENTTWEELEFAPFPVKFENLRN